MTVFYYKIRKSVNIQWQPTIHHILITSKCSPNSSHHWPEQPKKIIHTTWTIRSELMTFFPPFFETSFKSYLKYDTETLKKFTNAGKSFLNFFDNIWQRKLRSIRMYWFNSSYENIFGKVMIESAPSFSAVCAYLHWFCQLYA